MRRLLYSILTVVLICSFATTGTSGEIHDAVKKNQLTEVEKYVARGDMELPDKNGLTPLLVAAYYGHTDIVKYLCDEGARVNADDNKGWTALMFAAYYNYTEIARILIAHHADKRMKNPKGFTAFYYAKKYGHHNIAKMLAPPKQAVKIAKRPVARRQDAHDSRYRVAIFPWADSGGSIREEIEHPLDQMVDFINDDKLFKLDSSYYEIEQFGNSKVRKLRLFNKRSIWLSIKPSLSNICELGEKLKFDTVIVGSYGLQSRGATDIKVYLVDIKTKKLFSVKSGPGFFGRGNYAFQTEFDTLLTKLFSIYKKHIF